MKKILITSFFLLQFFVVQPILAKEPPLQTPSPANPKTDASGQTCSPSSGMVCIDNPLKDKADTPQEFIGQIIKGLLGIVGSIALAMFVYGGFLWMTAAGDKSKVTKGRETMLWATLGLAVIFSSYALVRFVIEKVTAG